MLLSNTNLQFVPREGEGKNFLPPPTINIVGGCLQPLLVPCGPVKWRCTKGWLVYQSNPARNNLKTLASRPNFNETFAPINILLVRHLVRVIT